MSLENRARINRRKVIGGALGATFPFVRTAMVRAQSATGLPAAVGTSNVKLRAEADRDSAVVTGVGANSPVRIIAGPDTRGWYRVQADTRDGHVSGWTHGDGLVFTQTAVLLWDVGVFAAPSDASGWLSTIRKGVVVTVMGVPTSGFTLIRFGALEGYVISTAVQFSDQPATDPFGEWWADVNRSTLTVNLMIGTTIVDSFPASMSSETGDGFYSTAPGRYWVYEKVEGLQYTTYAKAYFMYWCGFDSYRYNGFHSWTMDRNGYVLNGGWGNTSGCVATEPRNASTIYRFLGLNARVDIHW